MMVLWLLLWCEWVLVHASDFMLLLSLTILVLQAQVESVLLGQVQVESVPLGAPIC